MRYVFLLSLLGLIGCTQDPVSGEQTWMTFNDEGIDGYWLYLPDNFQADLDYPLILHLGGGAAMSTNPSTARDQGPGFVAMQSDLSEALRTVRDSFLIVSPHMTIGPKGTREWDLYTSQLHRILNQIEQSEF